MPFVGEVICSLKCCSGTPTAEGARGTPMSRDNAASTLVLDCTVVLASDSRPSSSGNLAAWQAFTADMTRCRRSLTSLATSMRASCSNSKASMTTCDRSVRCCS